MKTTAAEEAALRAKIQALRNVLQVSKTRAPARPTRFQQQRAVYRSPAQPMNRSWNRFGASANRVWRNEDASAASSAAPTAVVADSSASSSRAPVAVVASSWKRPLKAAASTRHATYQTLLAKRARNRMQLHVLKLEDGEYAKANGGFSLIRAGVAQRKPAISRSSVDSSRAAAARASNMVRIGGTDYVVARTGHSLKRMTVGETSKAAAAKYSAAIHTANHPASAASRAQAVVLRARNARLKKKKKTAANVRTEYCYCNKKNACSFLHDSRRVAICRKFLRDACTDEGCLLSHKHDQNKMPVCAMFLRGACTRDDCKYRHVKVSPSAQVCQAFLKGYCADGEACRLKHELPPPKKRAASVSGVASQQRALETHGTSVAVPAAKSARVESLGADRRGSVEQESVAPSDASAGDQRAAAASGDIAEESGGLSIRPTIRFRPKHASGFPSLLSVRSSLSS